MSAAVKFDKVIENHQDSRRRKFTAPQLGPFWEHDWNNGSIVERMVEALMNLVGIENRVLLGVQKGRPLIETTGNYALLGEIDLGYIALMVSDSEVG